MRKRYEHGVDIRDGIADERAVVIAGHARFTALTPTLLRLEYAPDGKFEDRPSFFALHRRLTPPRLSVECQADEVVLRTDAVELRYRFSAGLFDSRNLVIRWHELPPAESDIRGSTNAGRTRPIPTSDGPTVPPYQWRPGDTNRRNLGGTVRTLDGARGPVRRDDGLLSRDGWFFIDDSYTPVFTDDWITARDVRGRRDGYFFAYGRDYARALRDLVTLSGRIPVLPPFVFGSWYSRYWPYSADDFKRLVEEYREHGFPLDVLVMDMDWHKSGWTGYSWNRELIPDPGELLHWLHERGIYVTLNLHPASGVGRHEDAYADFARAMGRDPMAGEPIPFDCTDPRFMANYFALLHRPLERQGVDFWWLDWQQQRTSAIRRLDPLTWLNHLFYHDLVHQYGVDRALIFSRWGGWGSQRYPVQFSGDAESNWDVLAFEVELTAGSGNAGCAYWSHDIGGHWSLDGRADPELVVRWIQFGALSPVLRLHSTRDPLNDRRPWLDGEPFTSAARKAFLLRASLRDYLIRAAKQAHETGLPLCRPMYLACAHDEDAYRCPGQYMLGDDLIVVPVTRPGNRPRRFARVRCWLPGGEWVEWESQRRHFGPTWVNYEAALAGVVIFQRAGASVLPDALRNARNVRFVGERISTDENRCTPCHDHAPSKDDPSCAFVDTWWIAGPFAPHMSDPDVSDALRRVLAGNQNVETWRDANGHVLQWQRYVTLAASTDDPTQRRNHTVNMKAVFGQLESIGLARTTILSDTDTPAWLHLRHDDPLDLYFNGALIYRYEKVWPVYDPVPPIRIALRKGENHIVIVQKQFGDRWGFELSWTHVAPSVRRGGN